MPSSTSYSYSSLVLRLQENDETAWQELVDLFAPLIFHWCNRLQLDASDSSDVMQEVFAAVSHSIANFRPQGDGALRGWLWKITQNKVRDFYRKNNLRAKAIGGSTALLNLNQIADAGVDLSHEEMTSETEAKRLVSRALKLIENDFQVTTWTAFWRATIDGHDTVWISQDLGISPNSVRQAKSRVLRRLREQLGDV
jgi:RNA polymerase sigma-70 factor (ECF subfamily)